ADLWDGSIANPISVSELGTELNVHVWTGFQPNGTSPTNGSRIWRLGSGSGNGTVLAGNSASVDGAWAFVYNESKFATNHYYAVSNVFMVPLNTPPVANAGADQSVYVGATVALNGGASFDVETASQDLLYAWNLNGPVGSAAVLTGGDTATPSFVADVAGSYALTLTVTDAGSLTGSDEVIITVEDPKQVAGLAIIIATDAVAALTPSQVTTKGNQNALGNFLSQALKDIESGDIAKAIKKLQDALDKTDGCALRGAVDGKGSSQDWITTCESQQLVYELLTKAVAALRAVPAP
ncbi:MAG: hypothetical protein Q8M07_25765, partial [Prosthecobacter sp.]|nr:hypothetical protein [Prosthecobacter sp.]